MKLHIITVGTPKLAYARTGFEEYVGRLKHQHQLRITHLDDKRALRDDTYIANAAKGSYGIALVISGGTQFSSPELANFLEQRSMTGQEVSFMIGGPEGLPQSVIEQTDLKWSFSNLTFPHDLAMVILAEALYRASTINAGQPYHK